MNERFGGFTLEELERDAMIAAKVNPVGVVSIRLRLVARIRELEKAMEFYANVENWVASPNGMTSTAQKEYGAIARAALCAKPEAVDEEVQT